jgi:hypothetical protein
MEPAALGVGEDMDQTSGRRTGAGAGAGWRDMRRASVSIWDGADPELEVSNANSCLPPCFGFLV